jgi:hypothetical protein
MINYLEISTLKSWEKITQELTDLFIKKYFGKDAEWYWVADEIGGVLYVNDRFFNLSDIVDFLKCGYTPKQMFRYYDYRLENQEKGKPVINIKNYLKLK